MVSIRVVPFSSTIIHWLPKFCWGNQAGGAGNRNDQDPEFIQVGKGFVLFGINVCRAFMFCSGVSDVREDGPIGLLKVIWYGLSDQETSRGCREEFLLDIMQGIWMLGSVGKNVH